MNYSDVFDALDAMDAAFGFGPKTGKTPATIKQPDFPLTKMLKGKDGTAVMIFYLAGYKSEDIEIETGENKLSVFTKDTYKVPEVEERFEVVSNTAKESKFKVSYTVPETKFDFAGITARWDNGLLKVILPPKEKKCYSKIAIN